MFIGTSTGSIICGCLAAGASAITVSDIYVKKGKALFSKKSAWNPLNWLSPRYSADAFKKEIGDIVGPNRKMGEINKKLIITAFNLCSRKTHFIKSTDEHDDDFKLVDVISWSALSAAYYFGKICVPDYKWVYHDNYGDAIDCTGAVFQDGGQGLFNCPISHALVEELANNLNEVYILSLGCGSREMFVPYSEGVKTGFIGQIKEYLGQARIESTQSQIDAARFIESKRPSLNVDRIDCVLEDKKDELDAIDFINDFVQIGMKLSKKVDYSKLS
jgi:patatin-like phospholipase/acyl hydrolase